MENLPAKSRIIVALDVNTREEVLSLVQVLKDHVGMFKVGLELLSSLGPQIIAAIRDAGGTAIFYDGKLCDIPNTVSGASKAISRLGVTLFNVHCLGGVQMMNAAVEAAHEVAEETKGTRPKVLGVTILTSIDQGLMNRELCISGEVLPQVVHFARLAQQAGLDGVVCSPREISAVREVCGPDFCIVTPGVRPKGMESDDQKRVMTPTEAITAGADYIVVGRPITKAKDPAASAVQLFQE